MRTALLLLFAAIPVQWLLLPGLPSGAARVHVLAILAFAALVFLRHPAKAHLPVLRLTWAFVVANVALLVVWYTTAFYHGQVPLAAAQETMQLFGFVAVATVIYRAAREPSSRVLEAARWTALVSGISLIVALAVSMGLNGVDPLGVLNRAILQGNPEVIERELFRSAFTGFGYDDEVVRGNIRHEVLGAVLTGMYLSAAAVRLRPFSSPFALRLFQASMVLGAVLLLTSMSRSVILAALVWPVLVTVRSVLTNTLTTRQLAGVFAALGLLAGAAVTGFLSVIWVRFAEDTASYEKRDELLQQAVDNIVSNMLTGGVATESASSHNFVLDTWLRTGLFGAVAALVIIVLLVGLWGALLVRIGVEPMWMVPVTAAMALPLMRLFTAGGGVIPPVQWVGLGVVAGFLTYRASLQRDATSSRVPAGAAAASGGRA